MLELHKIGIRILKNQLGIFYLLRQICYAVKLPDHVASTADDYINHSERFLRERGEARD